MFSTAPLSGHNDWGNTQVQQTIEAFYIQYTYGSTFCSLLKLEEHRQFRAEPQYQWLTQRFLCQNAWKKIPNIWVITGLISTDGIIRVCDLPILGSSTQIFLNILQNGYFPWHPSLILTGGTAIRVFIQKAHASISPQGDKHSLWYLRAVTPQISVLFHLKVLKRDHIAEKVQTNAKFQREIWNACTWPLRNYSRALQSLSACRSTHPSRTGQ